MVLAGKTVSVISLGCDKNRVDTEYMMQLLHDSGCVFVHDNSLAQIIIVNTCGFIEPARKEAIDTVLCAAENKNNGKCEKLIVTGCLVQKYSEQLKELYEADAILGTESYSKLCGIIERLYSETPALQVCEVTRTDPQFAKRFVTTPPHYAYLKIAEGCSNCCTYCTIPSIRGPYRSVSMESVIAEARVLIDGGARELIVVAQDTTRYGIDLYGKPSLAKLAWELSKLGADWIRLMYCYPELVTDELIRTVSENDKICKYLDIPLQHINTRILKLMNRRSGGADIRKMLDNIAKIDENIIVRSSFILGFPTETEAEYIELLRFIEEGRIGHAGFFAYSQEPGTPAAKLVQVPKRIRSERVRGAAAAQQAVVFKNNGLRIGRTLRVLYEGIDFSRGRFYGRTEHNAPQADTLVYFTGGTPEVGNFYNVEITGYDGYDLTGVMHRS